MRFKMNRKTNKSIIAKKIKSKKTFDKLEEPIIYSPEDYGISIKYTGSGTKMLIIDSGCPSHKNIETKIESHDFIGENNVFDEYGHATIVAGLIASRNKKSMIGIAPDTKIHYAKVTDKDGSSNYSSVVSSVLWGIVKNVDIIVIALGSDYDYNLLHDCLKKAKDNNILVFASAGNQLHLDGQDVNYPAKYPEVISVANLTRAKKNNDQILKKVDFALKNKTVISTYMDNKYIEATGSSISTAIVSGLASLLVEKFKTTKKENRYKKIKEELKKILK